MHSSCLVAAEQEADGPAGSGRAIGLESQCRWGKVGCRQSATACTNSNQNDDENNDHYYDKLVSNYFRSTTVINDRYQLSVNDRYQLSANEVSTTKQWRQ